MYIYIQCKMAIRIFLAVLPLLSSFASLNICTFCIKIFYGSHFLLFMDNIVKSIFIYILLNNTYMQAIDYTVYIQLEMAILQSILKRLTTSLSRSSEFLPLFSQFFFCWNPNGISRLLLYYIFCLFIYFLGGISHNYCCEVLSKFLL